MNKLIYLILSLYSLTVYSQTSIFTVAGGGVFPTGWSGINNITSDNIDRGSYYLVQPGSPGDFLTTASYNLCTYTSATLSVDIGSFGSGTHRALLVEVSVDGGSTYTQSYTTNVTTGSAETTISPLINIAPLSDDVVLRFSVNSTTGRGIRMQNIELEANGTTTCPTACAAPTTQASGASTTGITTNAGTLNWTRGNGDNVLVVLQATSAAGTPLSGTTYTDNTIFGNGDAIGSGFIVYKGSGVSAVLTNLAANTTYHYAIYEYATTGICYLKPGLIGTFTTIAISSSSDIISSGGESLTVPSTEITSSPLTSMQGIKVWDFTIRDGGSAASDLDALPTILEDLTITQSTGNEMDDWDIAIQSADIFDGATHIATGTITSNEISFTGLPITAPDNSSKTITLRISLNCPSNSANNLDTDDFRFQISQNNVTEASTATSQFATFPIAQSIDGLNAYDLNSVNITSVTPTSGPTGTQVTLNTSAGGFTGASAISFNGTSASSFTVVSDYVIIATLASGTISGDITVTDAFCLDNTFSSFTVIDNDNSSCEGSVTFSDIIISEIYDHSSGSLGYIEIYNGTGTTIDLTGYSIRRYGTLAATTSTHIYTFPASGIGSSIADGQVLFGKTSTNASSIQDFNFTGSTSGFNANDRLELYNGTTLIDDFHDAVVGSAGYIYRRNTTITGPNTTFDASEWDATATSGDVSDLGSYAVSSSTSPTITSQPTTSRICAENDATLTVVASEGFVGGLGLTYQWFESAPGSTGWIAMTDGGIVSGSSTATLTISPSDGFDGFQYYCQVKENIATCFNASDAIQLDVAGSGGTTGVWTGNSDSDWCNCLNWHDGKTPLATTNILVDESAANDCIVSTGCIAIGSSLNISSSNGTNRLLTITGTGSVNITNAININKIAGTGDLIISTLGSGSLTSSSVTITGSGLTENAILRNESAAATIDINGPLTISSNAMLDLNANGTINIEGDFTNNNSAAAFDEATSTITFDGSTDQNIITNGFTETFHNITLNKTGGTLILQNSIDIDITGVIALSDGQINLNSQELRVLNPSIAAFTRSTGSIIEESGAITGNNAGKLIWDIGTTTGLHSFPLAAGLGSTYIPFEFELTAGDAGEVSISTYGTASNNLPLPTAPEAVTNLNSVGGLIPDNREATVDRFWQIDVENTATANLTFSYQATELPSAPYNDHSNLIAQRYNSALNKWENQIHPGQTGNVITGGFNVTVPNISTFSPWTLAHINSPLPAELIDFKVKKSKNIVILDWITSSEINTDEFILEKSKDAKKFHAFASKPAAGNSNSNIEYTEMDYNPFNGFNFYRLKTIDFDGSYKYSNVKSVFFNNDLSHITYQDQKWIISSKETIIPEIQLINTLGQYIDIQNIVSYTNSEIVIEHYNLPVGIYIIQVNSELETFNFKVFK